MLKLVTKIGMACALFALTATSSLAIEWNIRALTPEYILVQADTSKDEQAAFFADERYQEDYGKIPNWKIANLFKEIFADVKKNVREPMVEQMKTIPGFCSYWVEANGVKRFYRPDDSHFTVKDADVIHNAFIKVPPMKKGSLIDLGVAGTFTYNPQTPTPIFKINQVGYAPNARKYAYVGGWLGLTGPLPLKQFAGQPFYVVNAKNNKLAFNAKSGIM